MSGTGTTSGSPTSWLLDADSALTAILQGRLQNIEQVVNDSLQWLNLRRVELSMSKQFAAPRKRNRGRPRKRSIPKTEATVGSAKDQTPNSVLAVAALPGVLATPVRATAAPISVVPPPPTTVSKPSMTIAAGAPSTVATSTMKRKRGRAGKSTTTLSASIPTTPIAVAPISSLDAASGTLKRSALRAKANASGRKNADCGPGGNAAPPTTPQLSSFGSPMKTPLPIATGKRRADDHAAPASLQLPPPPAISSRTPPYPAPSATATQQRAGETSKIEAWTSKFIKNTSLGAPREAAAAPSRELPFVELPPIVSEAQGVSAKIPTVPPSSTSEANRPAAASGTATGTETGAGRGNVADGATTDTSDASANTLSLIEFVPPPPSTVTRRAIRKDLLVAAATTAEYVESPLTRAKRVDAQNTWRERQLQTYLTAKADSVKSALSSLRIASTPVAAVAGNNGATIASHPDAASGDAPDAKQVSSPRPLAFLSAAATDGEASPAVPAPASSEIGESADLIAAEEPPHQLDDDFMFDFDALHPVASDRTAGSFSASSVSAPDTETDALRLPTETLLKAPQETLQPALPSSAAQNGGSSLDPRELERRRRLKERNERAVEKKKQLLQKAQQIRSQTVANLSGKPRDLPPTRKATATATASTAMLKTATATSLGKAVLAAASSTVSVAVKGQSIETPPRKVPDGVGGNQSGVFKLPLPKVKTPGSVTKSSGRTGDHPSSDDTFTTAQKSNRQSGPHPASPKLPHIPSDSSEDELVASRDVPPPDGKERRPLWALTPEVSRSLHQQRSIRPEDIFGEVEPVKLEDFFKDSGKKYARGRTSSVWHP